MSPVARVSWIAMRALAAIITVPIAEELGYRGYLMRRIRSADFEAVRFAQVGWKGLAVSAIVFGVAHGSMWLPGIAAGLVYGLLPMRTGRFGEAVAAHATTNILIAAWVLAAQQWQLW
jgi:CAAX prenyl protease-like protein